MKPCNNRSVLAPFNDDDDYVHLTARNTQASRSIVPTESRKKLWSTTDVTIRHHHRLGTRIFFPQQHSISSTSFNNTIILNSGEYCIIIIICCAGERRKGGGYQEDNNDSKHRDLSNNKKLLTISSVALNGYIKLRRSQVQGKPGK